MRGTTPLIRSRRDWVATTDPLPTKSFDVIVARLTRGAETIAESFAPCRIGSPPPACASILSTSHFASAEVTTPPAFQPLASARFAAPTICQHGRGSCREKVCPYG